MGAGGGADTSRSEALAEQGNQIAIMQYLQSQQQYNEQRKEEKDEKARARANAAAIYKGGTVSYSHYDTGRSVYAGNNASGYNTMSLLSPLYNSGATLGGSVAGYSNKLGG